MICWTFRHKCCSKPSFWATNLVFPLIIDKYKHGLSSNLMMPVALQYHGGHFKVIEVFLKLDFDQSDFKQLIYQLKLFLTLSDMVFGYSWIWRENDYKCSHSTVWIIISLFLPLTDNIIYILFNANVVTKLMVGLVSEGVFFFLLNIFIAFITSGYQQSMKDCKTGIKREFILIFFCLNLLINDAWNNICF